MALLLFLALVSAPFLSAQALTPTTRADYETWFPTGVSILEQKYGTNNLGDTNAHAVLLSLGTYEYQFTATDGLYADPDDFTLNTRTNDLVLTFTGSNLPKSVCLGLIATDQQGAYLSGIGISYSVNGGTDAVYTTKSAFADNALVITDEDGISTVVLRGQSSAAWNGYSYILLPSVNKLPQDAPAAPTVQSKTAASVTLTPITGAEYSMDGTTWQESNEFTGLSPVTDYTFYARLKETDTLFASPASTGTNVTTDKADQQAPAAPSVQSKTAVGVTLTPITGAEYSMDGTTWQDSNEFTGLTANTTYTFYARYKGTDVLNPSATSQISVTTLKNADDSPATGDPSDLLVWLMIVSAAVTGIAITVKKFIRSINKAEK